LPRARLVNDTPENNRANRFVQELPTDNEEEGVSVNNKILLGVMLLSGCANHAKEIQPSYVSPTMYQNLNCEQMAEEGGRLRARVSQLGGQVDKQASRDSTQMTVGLILFWPTLFWLDGDTPEAHEYARLTGEYKALQEAMNKQCPTPSVTPPVSTS
jgi:outer membrane murein-binding lipoprotein Lpp